ncbi:MAG: exodeoxyribonuclease VII small subunit [Cytophagales bacterium]
MEITENLNYAQSFEELKKIVEEIENGEIGIDDLSKKVQRAAKLIKFLRAKLQSTEDEVNQIIKEM